MCGLAAWARATYQYHVNGTDTVGRSVDARTPVDHDSVGLAQARPNYNQIYWAPLHEIHVITLHPYPSTEDQT